MHHAAVWHLKWRPGGGRLRPILLKTGFIAAARIHPLVRAIFILSRQYPAPLAVEATNMLQQLHLRDRTYGQMATAPRVMDWQDSVPLTPRTLISERVRIEWEAQEAERLAKIREMAREEARGTLPPLVDVAMMRRLNPYRAAQAPVTLES
jgi:hypothetical protein